MTLIGPHLMKRKPLPSQDIIAFLLHYNKYTGEVNPYYNEVYKGDDYLTYIVPKGLSPIRKLRDTVYLLHRLIWKLCYNTEPEIIDHMNRDKKDNRIRNLREATPQTNGNNSGNPSLFKLTNGYFIDSYDRYNEIEYNEYGYYFRIRLDNQDHIIKHYPTKHEAYKAYRQFREEHIYNTFTFPNSLEERIIVPSRITYIHKRFPYVYKDFFEDTPPEQIEDKDINWPELLSTVR